VESAYARLIGTEFVAKSQLTLVSLATSTLANTTAFVLWPQRSAFAVKDGLETTAKFQLMGFCAQTIIAIAPTTVTAIPPPVTVFALVPTGNFAKFHLVLE